MSCNENAALFLDRDGTIIEDRGHLRDPSEMILFCGCHRCAVLLDFKELLRKEEYL